MKKILLSSAVLTIFAISIIIFQLSCKKTAEAQNGGTTSNSSAGIVLYDVRTDTKDEIWKVNIDGTGNQKVNIVLPANVEFNIGDGGNYRLTADAKKIVFNAENNITNKTQLYICNIDGSNLKLIIEGSDIDNLGDVN